METTLYCTLLAWMLLHEEKSLLFGRRNSQRGLKGEKVYVYNVVVRGPRVLSELTFTNAHWPGIVTMPEWKLKL